MGCGCGAEREVLRETANTSVLTLIPYSEPMVTERPYLTEAGPQTVDELGHLRRHHEHLLDPCTCQLAVRQVSTAQLVKDVVYLLVGIPSRTFPFSQVSKRTCLGHLTLFFSLFSF